MIPTTAVHRQPARGLLADSFGRTVEKLRISVTDRCNFRCRYCMPAGGVPWLPKAEILTFEEIVRLARVAIGLGITRFRLTGGEPTMRHGLPDLVRMLATLPGLEGLSITTNGARLSELGPALVEAGLRSFNVSLDTLDKQRFLKITRRDAFDAVMAGLKTLESLGVAIKVNAVMMQGVNDDEIEAFAALSRSKPYIVRFIEFMPLDAGHTWSRGAVVPAHEILERLGRVQDLQPLGGDDREPARRYGFADGLGEVGVIASVTEPFCGACNRIRITADGQLRTCLFSLKEHNLRDLLRAGATDDDIAGFLGKAVRQKEAGHLINLPGFVQPARGMSAIGG